MRIRIDLSLTLVDGDYRHQDLPELLDIISSEIGSSYSSEKWVFMIDKIKTSQIYEAMNEGEN